MPKHQKDLCKAKRKENKNRTLRHSIKYVKPASTLPTAFRKAYKDDAMVSSVKAYVQWLNIYVHFLLLTHSDINDTSQRRVELSYAQDNNLKRSHRAASSTQKQQFVFVTGGKG